MKNIAVILAGGVGSRLNAGIPKQFIKVAGMSIIEHSITIFEQHDQIDEIVIVANEAYHNKIFNYILKNNFKKVKKVLCSGKERYQSSLSAIYAYENEYADECNLIFHDAVRPLLSKEIITEVVKALRDYNAVDVAVPSSDTIIEIDENEIIKKIPPRQSLRRGQTPQGFRLSTIKKAYEIALQDPNFRTTDDCNVVLTYIPEEKIKVVAGSEANMKLTFKEDLFLIEKLFQLKTTCFQNHEFSDAEKHALKDKVIVVYGASSGIGADILRIALENSAKAYGFSRRLNNTDVSKAETIRLSLENVFKKEGRIDYIINTASILHKLPLDNISYEEIDNAIDINYKGMVNVAKESYKYLQESKGALMLFTSSSYTRGRMNYSIYSSTKCATVNFVQALSEEWINKGIRVQCINPERTKTPMRLKNFGVEDDSTLLKSEIVAKVSLKVLLSDITGQVVDVKVQQFS